MTVLEREQLILEFFDGVTIIDEDTLFERLYKLIPNIDDLEIFTILDKLVELEYVYEDEDISLNGKINYNITVRGKEFLEWGGFKKRAALRKEFNAMDIETKLNQRDLSRKQIKDYTSPRWSLWIGVFALVISAVFSGINTYITYKFSNPIKQIYHLELKLDSLQTLIKPTSHRTFNTDSAKTK